MPGRADIVLTVPTLSQGGTARVAVHLANGFAAAGYRTAVLAFSPSGTGGDALRRLLDPRVRIDEPGARRSFADLVRALRRIRPACVLSTANGVCWRTAAAVGAARVPGCRLVLKITNPIIRPKDGALRRRFRRFAFGCAFRAADLVLALSETDAQGLRAMFPRAADRIRGVVNPYVASPVPIPAAPPVEPARRERLVLAIGRLEPQKNMALLIEAFARVRTPRARLAILGDGGERARLEALVRARGLEGIVDLPGYVPDVAGPLRGADLFVLPSRYEGLPAVLFEAFAADCPVVSTDCFASAREFLAHAEGCTLLARADPDELAGAIERSLDRPRPTGLARIAARYEIGAAQRDHVRHLRRLGVAPG